MMAYSLPSTVNSSVPSLFFPCYCLWMPSEAVTVSSAFPHTNSICIGVPCSLVHTSCTRIWLLPVCSLSQSICFWLTLQAGDSPIPKEVPSVLNLNSYLWLLAIILKQGKVLFPEPIKLQILVSRSVGANQQVICFSLGMTHLLPLISCDGF